jgi:hypothetical protein
LTVAAAKWACTRVRLFFLGAESSSDSFLRCVLLMKNSNNPDHKT